MKLIKTLFCFLIFLNVQFLSAQCVLLHLSFEGSPNGKDGEAPLSPAGMTYETGINGSAVAIGAGESLFFDKVNNLDEQTGTLEFWINPHNLWAPLVHEYFLSCGVTGGLVALKDGTNSARMIFSQYSSPNPELDVAFGLGAWDMNAWHYVVYTWEMDTLNLYLDGQLVNSDKYCINMPPITCFTFPAISDPQIKIGPCKGAIDELVIHGCARNAAYVLNRFNNPLAPIDPPPPVTPESPDTTDNGIMVYELISPNNDGNNDVFYIQNIEKYPDHELTIINSWGDQIYHSKKYDNSWNASAFADGTYYYYLKINSSNSPQTYKGRLVIRR